MEKEKIRLDYTITCDGCVKIIPAGESVYPLYETNWEQFDIPLEEMRTEWVISFCYDCISQVPNKLSIGE